MEQVLVIQVHDSVVAKVDSFVGAPSMIAKQAEERFFQILKEDRDYSPEEIEDCLEDGYIEYSPGYSVAIYWL